MAAVLAAVTALPPARAEETAQHLVAAVRAAVAAPPSAGADMSAMVGWGEPLLAALRAAMSVPPLPPGDKPMAVPPSQKSYRLATCGRKHWKIFVLFLCPNWPTRPRD